MTATGELDGANTHSQASEQDFRYVWAPGHSQTGHSDHYSYLQSDNEFDFDMQEEASREKPVVAGLHDSEPSPAPFKFPEHDTVIKTARQLSNLASRQSSRTERLHHFQDMSEMGMQQRNAYSEPRKARGSRQHSHSASFTGPAPTGNFKSNSYRPRSRSANVPVGRKDVEQYPPPPVRVSVSKENIQVGNPSSGRTMGKLRYTSHWD